MAVNWKTKKKQSDLKIRKTCTTATVQCNPHTQIRAANNNNDNGVGENTDQVGATRPPRILTRD